MKRIELTPEQRGETEQEITDDQRSTRFLGALNLRTHTHRAHIYGGTVDAPEVLRRRKANKAARRSRRANR